MVSDTVREFRSYLCRRNRLSKCLQWFTPSVLAVGYAVVVSSIRRGCHHLQVTSLLKTTFLTLTVVALNNVIGSIDYNSSICLVCDDIISLVFRITCD